MKIKLITLDHLEGVEIDITHLMSVRFELDEGPEDWIDVIPHGNGIEVRSNPLLRIFPQAANAIAIFTTLRPPFITHRG